jgi:hypothetical protein
MAIVAKHGKPDIFVTFTCNPKWAAITDELPPGQTTSDRPDIFTRVFKIYLKELLNDVIHRRLFGEIVGYAYTIEFQKRGLPHAHLLLILTKNEKFDENEPNERKLIDRIDDTVTAEIPEEDGRLKKLVLKHMMHESCENDPNAICKVDGVCKRDFPKEFCQQTRVIMNKYPQYRRRRPQSMEE